MTTIRTLMVRPPAAAGAFYPGEPGRLASSVDSLLDEASRSPGPATQGPPHALVVPHAGYIYSGLVAAIAYTTIKRSSSPSRIVLAGPAHFVPLRGFAVPATAAWATPLGQVPVDEEIRRVALDGGAVLDDVPHMPEHSLEVQVPFLQRIVGSGLRTLPVAVGLAGHEETADLLGLLADASDLVVISTDLSHYHDEATARRLDGRTLDAVVGRDPERLDDDAACGIFALRGITALARARGWAFTLLDRRTSADAGGGRSRVVGYAALTLG